ncbi:MAG: hypothetical protein KGM24_02135 [Elusimicrobia bacterium]|nr:hypothetical protein [Elusimicrobiota bacterium]
MNRSLAWLTALLLAVPGALAAQPSGPGPAAPSADVITPLNVRDPSALVMGPESLPGKGLAIGAPAAPRPAVAPARAGKREALKPVFDKTPLRAGMRSVSVPVDADQLIGVKPGDRVDLIAVFDAALGSGAPEKLAATALQNVRVLGVAAPRGFRGKGALLLELNPMEAQYAALSARQADLSVAARAPGDVEMHPLEMAAFHNFFR